MVKPWRFFKVDKRGLMNFIPYGRQSIDDEDVKIVEEESFEDKEGKEELEQIKKIAESQGQNFSDVPSPMLHNCIITRTSSFGKVKIENVPPEEFLIQRTAKTIEDATNACPKLLGARV